MERKFLFFSGLAAVAGLGLSACSNLDIKDLVDLRCKTDPQSVVTEKLELLTGQSITVNNAGIKITRPGRLRFYHSAEITPEGDLITGNPDGRQFRVRGAAGADDRTIVTITFNCADPKNP